MEEQAINA